MRIIRITLLVILSLAVAAVLTWCILYYLVWPKPEISQLLPDTPLAYVAASNLGEIISNVQESEFANRVASSPFWRDLRSSGLWLRMKQQRRDWERQMKASINPEGIIQLMEKDAILAFYGDQGYLDILLISQVGPLTRMNITLRKTEKTLADTYTFTKEKYRGVKLKTLEVPGLKFSYGFIGRAGLLSTDMSLLKRAVDLHRGDGGEVAFARELEKLVVDMPGPRVSFHINAAKMRDTSYPPLISRLIIRAEADPYLRHLFPVTRRIDSCSGVGYNQPGDVKFHIRARRALMPRRNPTDSPGLMEDKLAVPANCMLFMLYRTLKPDTLFDALEVAADTDMAIFRDRLTPLFHNGAAMAVLEPNVKELQLLPPVMAFIRVKDKTMAQTTLKDLRGSIRIMDRQLEFTEMMHENTSTNYARVPIGMGMSIDAGYTFIGDDLLVMATDTSALKEAIDVILGKRGSLMKDEQYADVLSPLAEDSEGRVFMNINSIAAMTKQAARLYAWRAKIAGEREAEQIATILYQNVSILEAWRYMSITSNSNDGAIDAKVILSK